MKFIIKDTKTIEVENEVEVPMPFYFRLQTVYAGDRDNTYDTEENIWGMVYLVKDEYDNEVLRVTKFKQTNREYDDDMSDATYDIESFSTDANIQKFSFKRYIENQCTHEEFNRESTRIFKSITNQ